MSTATPSRQVAPLHIKWALYVVALLCVCYSFATAARENAGNDSGLATIERNKLPEQAQDILKLIRAGGPFKHAQKDGSTFGNFEKRLPKQPRGYYKEYTVPTPGAKNRGARRIVCGGDVQSLAKSTCYYTDDHYNSFKRILE